MKRDEIVQLAKIEACLQDVKAWMTNNFPLLNSDYACRPKSVITNQDLQLHSHIKQILKT